MRTAEALEVKWNILINARSTHFPCNGHPEYKHIKFSDAIALGRGKRPCKVCTNTKTMEYILKRNGEKEIAAAAADDDDGAFGSGGQIFPEE